MVDDLLDVYVPDVEKKHASPTKRLISLKNSTWDHKKKISQSLNKGQYSQTYCISPGKSYVVEAQGGELDYEIAEKSPKKFYSKLLGQGVKKVSVANQKITQEWTQRAQVKTLDVIQNKLSEKICEELGYQFQQDVQEALSLPKMQQLLMAMIGEGQIDLIDQSNQPLLKKFSVNADTGSAREGLESRLLKQAEIQIGDEEYSAIFEKVYEHINAKL